LVWLSVAPSGCGFPAGFFVDLYQWLIDKYHCKLV